jgi:hypothetical protein
MVTATAHRRLRAVFLLSWVASGGNFGPRSTVSAAQAQEGSQTPAVSVDESTTAAATTWSIARIREALAREPVIVIRQPTFRTGITEHRPTSFDLTEDTKPVKEPPAWNAGWHNEFLSMVTPPEFRTWQAFTNGELLQISATSLAAALADKALGAVGDWRRNSREAEARDEVDRALADFLATKAGATPEVVSPH